MATIAPFLSEASVIDAPLHPSERVRRRLPPIVGHIALAAAAAGVVLTTALIVRLALALLVSQSAQPLPPAVTLGRAAIVVDPAAAVIPPTAAVAPSIASPAAGTTGTAELPPVPLTAQVPLAGDMGIVAARPFSLAAASTIDRGRALECLTAAIYYEAASEPDDGQRAVAQVVLNRVRHPAFPASVCGVVYQGSERSGCQFSFACDGSIARIPSRSGWARAARVAAAALGGYVFAPVGLATHYHTYAVTPAWNRTLVMTDAIGAHFFHRWKGFWGTAAAFTQRYIGREPTPGPHPRMTMPDTSAASGRIPMMPITNAAIAATLPVAGVMRPVTPPQDVQAEHRSSGEPIARGDDAEGQVLDRWKDSGKPLY